MREALGSMVKVVYLLPATRVVVTLFLVGGVVKALAVVLVLLVLATAVVTTHPEVIENLAITSCERYVLLSAHASHPQEEHAPLGVTAKVGDFTYRPWGTVERVYVVPNSSDVREVVFVLNRTGLMEYFNLFSMWKPRDIALIVKINDRAIAFEFAYLYPNGNIKPYSNPNIRIVGNEVHVKVHGWRKEPCDMNIQFAPAVEFYNGVAPVNWLSLPGASARLKCASCIVSQPRTTTSTATGAPAVPTSTFVPEPQPTFTLPVVTSTPAFTHTTTHSNAPPTHTPARTSWVDQIRSAIQGFIERVREWFNSFRWPW